MWRRTTIASQETLSDTEVWEYSMPTNGTLNGIFLQLRATNGATSNLGAQLEQCVNSIQVVDGGRVLMDLTGPQAQLVTLIGTKSEPRSVVSEGADDVQTYQALLLFGLKLYDEQFGLNLANLRNPKIRVDFDLTVVRAAGATGFVTGSGRISAVLIVNDGADAIAPPAFIKSHEIKRFTTASSGDESTQAPIDAPWARVLVRAYVTNNNPDDVLTDIKVTFDSGRFVAVDEKTRWAADAIGSFLGRVPRLAYTAFKKDTETFDTRSGGIDSFTSQALIDTNVAVLAAFEAGRPAINLNVLGAGTTQATEDDIYITVFPNAPYMSFMYDFVPQGMLPVSEFARGDIVLTQGVSGAAASIVLQQVVENVAA